MLAVLLVFVGPMRHTYQHQYHVDVVCDRVAYCRTHVLQSESCLVNAAAHFCDHIQQTLVIGDSYNIEMFR